jgi:hypothetical protein
MGGKAARRVNCKTVGATKMIEHSEAQSSLLQAAKRHWRSFVPVWLFPVCFFFGWLATNKTNHPFLLLTFFFVPFFFWSFFRSTRPWMRREIKYSHYSFWAMMVPFLIWVVLVYGRIFILEFLKQSAK